jgi:hypothetical protein
MAGARKVEILDPELAGHEVVKEGLEQFPKRLPAMCFCFELPFGREETLCDFGLLCGRRNWHRPRFQEANVNVLLCSSRGKAVHLVLLCPQVKSKILVGKTTSRYDANETIGECTVKIEDPGVANVSRNCQNDCAFRKHPTDGQSSFVECLGVAYRRFVELRDQGRLDLSDLA